LYSAFIFQFFISSYLNHCWNTDSVWGQSDNNAKSAHLLQFNPFRNGLTLPCACDKLPHQLNLAHQERQRDRPCEASATASKVPIPAGLAAWEMRVDIL